MSEARGIVEQLRHPEPTPVGAEAADIIDRLTRSLKMTRGVFVQLENGEGPDLSFGNIIAIVDATLRSASGEQG